MGQLGSGHSEEFLKRRREQEQIRKERRRKRLIALGLAAILLVCTGTIAGVSGAVSSGKQKAQMSDVSEQASERTAGGGQPASSSDSAKNTAGAVEVEILTEGETTPPETNMQTETAATEIIEGTGASDAGQAQTQTSEEQTQAAPSGDGTKVVYLTFDDGPSTITEPLLDMLDACGVKATFFDVGIRIEQYPDLAVETLNRGHVIGLHSYDHDYSHVYSSLEGFADSTLKAQAALRDATGVTSYLYRFPGGSSNLVHQKFGSLTMTACANWLTDNGFTYDDWNVSSGDANETPYTADEIADMVIQGVGDKDTAVVLMHNIEGKESTIDALPRIVDTLREKGYTFGTLSAGGETVHHHLAD